MYLGCMRLSRESILSHWASYNSIFKDYEARYRDKYFLEPPNFIFITIKQSFTSEILSISDLDFSSYLLLYGITLYNISQQTMTEMDIPLKDRQVIGKVRETTNRFSLQYSHFLGSDLLRPSVPQIRQTPAWLEESI